MARRKHFMATVPHLVSLKELSRSQPRQAPCIHCTGMNPYASYLTWCPDCSDCLRIYAALVIVALSGRIPLIYQSRIWPPRTNSCLHPSFDRNSTATTSQWKLSHRRKIRIVGVKCSLLLFSVVSSFIIGIVNMV